MSEALSQELGYGSMSRQGVSRTAKEPVAHQLIGLIGKARVGKDTAADYLADQYGLLPYAFANPMKDALEGLFGDFFYGGDREKVIDWLGKSPRQLMQTLGTEWGRDCVHPDLWVLLAKREWQSSRCGMVFSDVRFQNEADWILSEGGTLIEILRPEAGVVNSHVSEGHVWGITKRLAVPNDDSLSVLYGRLDEVMDTVRGR